MAAERWPCVACLQASEIGVAMDACGSESRLWRRRSSATASAADDGTSRVVLLYYSASPWIVVGPTTASVRPIIATPGRPDYSITITWQGSILIPVTLRWISCVVFHLPSQSQTLSYASSRCEALALELNPSGRPFAPLEAVRAVQLLPLCSVRNQGSGSNRSKVRRVDAVSNQHLALESYLPSSPFKDAPISLT